MGSTADGEVLRWLVGERDGDVSVAAGHGQMAVAGGRGATSPGRRGSPMHRFGAGRAAEAMDMLGKLCRERRRHMLCQQHRHRNAVAERLEQGQQGCRATRGASIPSTVGR